MTDIPPTLRDPNAADPCARRIGAAIRIRVGSEAIDLDVDAAREFGADILDLCEIIEADLEADAESDPCSTCPHRSKPGNTHCRNCPDGRDAADFIDKERV